MDQFRSATSGYSASVCSNRQNTMSDQGVDVDFEADYIDGDNEPPRKRGRTQQRTSEHCPYLAEISRKLLDFDFEKVCSVSLSNLNVYGCLVCGKYFQGRGKQSHAYIHSVQQDHHVFINLESGKIYCLPDGYEVIDPSLEDIQYCLHPKFARPQAVDNNTTMLLSHSGDSYLPGYIGLNDISSNDWLNATVQALVHVAPLRSFFLVESNYEKSKLGPQHDKALLASRFGELTRKIWNPRSFKPQVSPQELLQACSVLSNKLHRPGQQSDPVPFISWFLNTLHRELGGSKKHDSSVVYKTFQGELLITTESIVTQEVVEEKQQPTYATSQVNLAADAASETSNLLPKPTADAMSAVQSSFRTANINEDDDEQVAAAVAAAAEAALAAGAQQRVVKTIKKQVVESNKQPFLFLSLTLPPTPLFKDAIEGGSIIPQEPLFNLLKKFDGQTAEILADGSRRYYSISRLPRYLIVHIKRFTINQFVIEKNPTIVNFPVKNLDLHEYVSQESQPAPERAVLESMSVTALKQALNKRGVAADDCVEKAEMIQRLLDSYDVSKLPTKYDLIANIVHTGAPQGGSYKAQIYCRAKDQWYEMENLHVTETMPQLVAVSEAYVQIYELQQ